MAHDQTGPIMGDFRKLSVWQKAHAITLGIYRATSGWPRHEIFALTSQARRSAVSIPANIAEGCGKNSDGALARHARDSLGSASELSYYLILAHDLGYLDGPVCDDMQGDLSEVRRMLSSLERVSAMAARRQWPAARLRRKGPDFDGR
jgi:four helix bundle protein